ncbi:MAG TPA: VIT family protein [Candidatus Nanopelagicaceae bacterium]|nr:VIT family protein [Candidatus Nanopelagicaceae bacterium]
MALRWLFPRTDPSGENHHTSGTGGLRAAVLGADDGIVSTASLMLGVAASRASHAGVITAGIAGVVAGAMSMAAGEYVSVSSQRDAERADLNRERAELRADPAGELEELTQIYVARGIEYDLARQVAVQLTEVDPLAAHARDELGITDSGRARPIQAAGFSATSFVVGGLPAVLAFALAPASARIAVLAIVAVAALGLLGTLGAIAGGANWRRGALRVLVGGTAAMAITALVGQLVGSAGL